MFGKAKKVVEVILDENGNPVAPEKKFNWKKAAVITGIAAGVVGAGAAVILNSGKKKSEGTEEPAADTDDAPFIATDFSSDSAD